MYGDACNVMFCCRVGGVTPCSCNSECIVDEITTVTWMKKRQTRPLEDVNVEMRQRLG